MREDALGKVPALTQKKVNPQTNPLNRHSVDNAKITDHHAIIPTGETPSGLLTDEAILYNMVVTRFIEAFSPDSEEERMQVAVHGRHQHLYLESMPTNLLGLESRAERSQIR